MADINNNILEAICSLGGDSNRLTVSQKQWVGEQVVDGGWTVSKLALRIGLRHRIVKRYAHKVRHRTIFKSGPGRARLLDQNSVDVLHRWASENDGCSDDEQLDVLVERINFEKVETVGRRLQDDQAVSVGAIRRVSQRSLGRYIKIALQAC